jgi:hypothetical protein
MDKTFTQLLIEDRKGKGWFEVKDIIILYINFRGYINNWQHSYMSGDASWRLKLLYEQGKLERVPNTKHKGHYYYRVVKKDETKQISK